MGPRVFVGNFDFATISLTSNKRRLLIESCLKAGGIFEMIMKVAQLQRLGVGGGPLRGDGPRPPRVRASAEIV